ncbi:MAG: hypothetical protein HUU21_10645 [Polyangiaceae bacterium]|nr:hypothetical protein [Polyangiaceae bacterium]
MRDLLRLKQATMGYLFIVAGAIALIIAPLRDKSAFVMSPGLEGCLTAGVVGLALAILGGIGYRGTVALALPIFVAQFLGCRGSGEPVLATLGLEALMLGLLGIVMTPREVPAQEAPSIQAAPTPAAKSSRRRRAQEIAVASATLRG